MWSVSSSETFMLKKLPCEICDLFVILFIYLVLFSQRILTALHQFATLY